MMQPNDAAKRALIKKTAAAARRGAPPIQKKYIGAFTEAFYANIAPEDVLSCSRDYLSGCVVSAWEHLQKRRPGHASVRIFNAPADHPGWDCPHSVIQIVNDDMPFLVDSVAEALNRQNYTIHLMIHPVVRVRRDRTGQLLGLVAGNVEDPAALAESIMHVEINPLTRPDALRDVKRRLASVLVDVRHAVEDWRAMRGRIADVIAELDSGDLSLPQSEVGETVSFLRWVSDNHFTFLGYREYDFKPVGRKTQLRIRPRTGLGILRAQDRTIFEGFENGAELPPDIADFLRKPAALMVRKAKEHSTVHRTVSLDTIGIKTFDRRGKVVGERLFAGLFTSDVYNETVQEIPLLRGKVESIVARAGFPPNGHDGKALIHVLETLPRDELLQVGIDQLLQTSLGILRLQERPRVALFVHRDPFGRHASCLVYVPQDRYDTRLRQTLQNVLQAGFGGEVTAHYTQVSDSPLARIQFIVRLRPGIAAPKTDAEIEQILLEAARDWRNDLLQNLIGFTDEERGQEIFHRFGGAFPVAYRERFSADAAISDIGHIGTVIDTGMLGIDLYRPDDDGPTEFRLKLFSQSEPLPLSDVLPVLENMGLKVIDEVPHKIEPGTAGPPVWIHDFGLVARNGADIDITLIKALFEEAFLRVWNGAMENDRFNRLVISTHLSWRKIVILRAYCKFLRQAGIPFSQSYLAETLANNPDITRRIVDLFDCLFNPAQQGKQGPGRLEKKILAALDAVVSLDEDRILRRYLNAVQSTLRTNFFQTDKTGSPKTYLSLKFDSTRLDELPLPRPDKEIFVHSPRVDAVHLRGGAVARGGIRWSDRREDFRTEILGLMKSQMTKNAVIVPVGAKGGFIVKQSPVDGGREALLEEAIACYSIFMRGLLDITDNLRAGKIVPPVDVVRRDGDDPYLVVAADKGTATFSDIANAISAEYGFWLSDAFASGGSAGYDHKAMGITARGAWESVKRHFRERGHDVMTTPFGCIGVGDMSGDVFGNGMIYSPRTRLIGAFNHQHIFIDPDPDLAASFRERKRLFNKGRSSWTDYDSRLISSGGGIFDRAAKTIKVTPQMRKAFGLSPKELITPTELIRAMLVAKIDLLWFGGIGTYIKSRDESNIEVGDRANDMLRIDGREVGASVIGEGANLGATQLGRVEFALRGGRINTDFIDNSAGVDCSDHEVNLKILLGAAVDGGKLSLKARNRMLVAMTDDVSALVLMDNYRQSMALTNAEHQSLALASEQIRFVRALEKAGDLDRTVEFLPSDDDMETRVATGAGLTRPELSVLLAYAKNVLLKEVLTSNLPDDPYLIDGLALYFPPLVRKPFKTLIPQHRLRREIIATYVANTVVNRTGPSFFNTLRERTGASPSAIARAYLICREVFRIAAIWSAVEQCDNSVPAEVQTEMQLEILELITRGTVWFLKHAPRDAPIGSVVDTYRPAIERLDAALGDILSPALKASRNRKAASYAKRHAPATLAEAIANLDALAPACDIIRIAAGGPFPPTAVAQLFYDLGTRFGFDWLRDAAEQCADGDEWRRKAADGIVEDLFATQARLTRELLDVAGSAEIALAIIDSWIEAHRNGVDRVLTMIKEIKTAPTVELTMLSVVNRELNALVTA
jgi:glutamate dehydrogenase